MFIFYNRDSREIKAEESGCKTWTLMHMASDKPARSVPKGLSLNININF